MSMMLWIVLVSCHKYYEYDAINAISMMLCCYNEYVLELLQKHYLVLLYNIWVWWGAVSNSKTWYSSVIITLEWCTVIITQYDVLL